jgi:hypothetical protein
MTDRDRLINLIQDSVNGCARHWAEIIADYLLANGVIVPQCNFKDTIYRIGSKSEIYGDWELMYIQVYPDEILYIDDSDNYFTAEDIGKTVFLTKEEAEEKLKELK